jgi:hypothetical protein
VEVDLGVRRFKWTFSGVADTFSLSTLFKMEDSMGLVDVFIAFACNPPTVELTTTHPARARPGKRQRASPDVFPCYIRPDCELPREAAILKRLAGDLLGPSTPSTARVECKGPVWDSAREHNRYDFAMSGYGCLRWRQLLLLDAHGAVDIEILLKRKVVYFSWRPAAAHR